MNKLTGGLGTMCKQRKVNYVQGEASFVNSTTLKVKKSAGGEETLSIRQDRHRHRFLSRRAPVRWPLPAQIFSTPPARSI